MNASNKSIITSVHIIESFSNLTDVIFRLSRHYCNIVDEGCGANYKQTVAEYVRGGAKTKDMRQRQKTRGC